MANVFIKGFEIGVSTDLDGSFLLPVPEGIFIDSFSLKISCLGYSSLEIINSTIQDFGIKKAYYLKKDEIMYLGGVSVVYTEPIKKKKW